ncbi:GrpB family protein, partial [Escherichia coli]|uniref:GrpB family protein n=1 Tax=Escherichia coli TaxID=562 RepID=UPI001FF3E390
MEYNPDWTKNFEEEKIKLLHFFGSHAVAIEHIGSTARHCCKVSDEAAFCL